MDFNDVWERIIRNQGELFYTVKDLPFTYQIIKNSVVTNRTNYPINKSQFVKAYEMGELHGPGEISKIVRGPAYVYAILTDSRIR